MKAKILKVFLLLGIAIAPCAFGATISLPPAKILATSVSGPNNFHFRVEGVTTTPECTYGFIFVDEADAGAKVKIANLMSAYYTGKKVRAEVDPVNYKTGS